MREMTIRIRFTRHCLGNVRKDGGRFHLLRTPDDRVMFLTSWHQRNMRLAAQLLGRHQTEVDGILWDVAVDGALRADRWFRRYYGTRGNRSRWAEHEAFFPGQVVSINCAVPGTITDDDLLQLMGIAGRYRGLSPWRPGEFGHFEVDGLWSRRGRGDVTESKTETADT